MKLISLLFCGAVFFQDYAHGHLNLNNDGIMGVSQKKLNDYMTKVIEGFKHVILNGDEELGYPKMEPYELEDASWDIADKSGSKKYRLNFFNTNKVIIKGLSDYKLNKLEASAKDMSLSFDITFKELLTKFSYKLDGYMLKNFLPLYGEGIVELSTQNQQFHIKIDLGIEQNFIVVERVDAIRYRNNIDVKATGLMDLPDPFANLVVDDILDTLVKQSGHKILGEFVRDVVEEAIGGMTTEEFFDYLDNLAKKNDQQ